MIGKSQRKQSKFSFNQPVLLSAKLHVGLAELAVEEKEREPVIIASTEEPSVWTGRGTSKLIYPEARGNRRTFARRTRARRTRESSNPFTKKGATHGASRIGAQLHYTHEDDMLVFNVLEGI